MKKSSTKLRTPNPLFHLRNKSEDQSVVSATVLRQARKSGKLNLSNKCFATIPDEVFTLGDVHSDDKEVNLDGNKNSDSYKWWELEPLNYLDISSNSIKDIPPRINQLDNLVTLILHHNNIVTIPPELGNLRKLLKLDLAHNKISYLPYELVGLKELKTLNLSYNAFEKFPECVYDLVMLNNLDLSHNQLCQVPPGVGFLVRLVDLNISHNKLTSVAPDISNCKALLQLDLSNNEITTEGLPHLGDLHNVQMIQLQYNKLTLLPKINGCSSLKEIHLGYNKMEEITVEELSTLSHLQIINLRDNKISKLPKEMSCLQNLIRLDLTNNNLKELPATLSLLPHLENLQIEGNSLRTIRRDIITGGTQRLLKYLKQTLSVSEEDKKLVAQLPCHSENGFPDRFSMRSSKSLNLSSQGLCNIPNEVFEEALQVPCNMIDLSKNKLMEVPSGVWKLSVHLTDLNLSHNQLKQLPGQIGNCSNLTYLNLETNQLTSLPEELSNCNRLREININCNKFEEVPECVYELKTLEILLARDNKIARITAEGFLKLKNLATLELSNNNISSVPPKLGNMTQLRSLGLDGNGLRNPRPAILAKGTDAVLSWLRDKIV